MCIHEKFARLYTQALKLGSRETVTGFVLLVIPLAKYPEMWVAWLGHRLLLIACERYEHVSVVTRGGKE